ncbi:MAG: putative transcriptional regulator, MarR-family [Thermoleophilia bacterium]|nr:putative transcriptional regulator, MarR-family [Thermoleophilia bacterium]
MSGNATRLSRLLLAYERYDASWRKQRGFTFNERHVILVLAESGPMSPTALSDLIGVTTAGMTGLLDRLEAEGYLTRRRHPDDGRRVLVTPTKRSLRAHDDLLRLLETLVEEHAGADDDAVAAFLGDITRGLIRASDPD